MQINIDKILNQNSKNNIPLVVKEFMKQEGIKSINQINKQEFFNYSKKYFLHNVNTH